MKHYLLENPSTIVERKGEISEISLSLSKIRLSHISKQYNSMQIDLIHLENFRAFEKVTVKFNKNFNVVIGGNGVGKTALLEALCVGVGSFFLGIDDADSRHIQKEDVRLVSYEHSIESQYPVIVGCQATYRGKGIGWSRTKETEQGRTTSRDASPIKNIANRLQQAVRDGENERLPVIVYFPTGRLWKERQDTGIEVRGSRLRGYYNALNPTSNYKFLLGWFKTKEFAAIQQGQESVELNVISRAVSNCIEDCNRIYFDIEEDELMMQFEDGSKMPAKNLSDGYRGMMAMVADIAFRCVILNPHLGENAALESKGVVLIDELDLHLHPSWQKRVIYYLKNAFPNIQFIATTHSPLIIASAKAGEVVKIPAENTIFNIEPQQKSYKGWQLDYILEDLMDMMDYQELNTGELLNQLNQAVNDGNMSLYDEKIRELEEVLHGNDPILKVYKMKKGELILNAI